MLDILDRRDLRPWVIAMKEVLRTLMTMKMEGDDEVLKDARVREKGTTTLTRSCYMTR